jgi:membrane protease YdiL (CAAX protease family)
MALLGWVVAPALGANSEQPGLVRLAVMTAGLVWQFVLVLIVLGREGIDRSWSSIRRSLWLTGPRSPKSGIPRSRLWWWVIPLLVLTAAYQMLVGPAVHDLWISLFPGLAEPPEFSLAGWLESPGGRARLEGAWGVLALFSVTAVFNTVLGEELLFRGLLLPRMNGVFG